MSRLPRFFVTGSLLALFGVLASVMDGSMAPSLAENAKLDAALSNSWWGHVPIMVAVDKGFFKELGIDVEVKSIASSADRIRALTSGSVAISNLGRIAVISEMANDNKSFYFFANVDDSPGNEGCWARPGFSSFKDLKGKK
jgi:NitT/TauT family transport system substrate-binding protein